jgi:hypothetical protein
MDSIHTLRAIGVNNIHNKTLISEKVLDNMLNERFETIHPVQFKGYIKILQRDFGLDLSDLEESYENFRNPKIGEDENEKPNVKVIKLKNSREKRDEESSSPMVWILVIAMMAGFALFVHYYNPTPPAKKSVELTPAQSAGSEDEVSTPVVEEETPTVQVVSEENIQKAADVLNILHDTNVSNVVENVEPIEEKIVVNTNRLVIHPKEEIWLGFTDLSTKKQFQTMTKEAFEVNATDDFLMAFGHGMVTIELYDRNETYDYSGRLKMHYKDGNLTKITNKQYRALKVGDKW